MNKLLDRILDIQGSKTKIDEQIQILEREQQRAKIAHDNLMKNAEHCVVSQAVHDRIKELEDQIATLEKNIVIERSKIDTKLKKEPLQKYYSEAIKRNAKEIVGLLINQIRVYNDKIEIKLNTPLKKSPGDNQGSYNTELKFTNTINITDTPSTMQTEYYV